MMPRPRITRLTLSVPIPTGEPVFGSGLVVETVAVAVAVSWVSVVSGPAPRALTTAVFVIEPREASAAVTVYGVPVQSSFSPGASAVSGQLTEASIGSFTTIELSVTLPVFVTRKVNLT